MSLTRDTSIKKIIRSTFSNKLPVQLTCTTKGRTKQSFKAECDINTIISRFLRTGVLDFAQKNQPRYGDCTGVDYQAALNTVAAAKSLFQELPAALRSRFENEPAKFLEFVQDERNYEEARALGLMKPVAKLPEPGAALPPAPDAHASHEPLRAPDGTFREQTRAEKRAEKRESQAAEGGARSDKTNSST